MKKIIILVLSLLSLSSCNDSDDYIQNVYVNIEVPVNQPEYSDLDAIGNSIFITGGVKGIIIYHANVNDYRAFDRNCSFEPSTQCAYIDSINSTIASCNCFDFNDFFDSTISCFITLPMMSIFLSNEGDDLISMPFSAITRNFICSSS